MVVISPVTLQERQGSVCQATSLDAGCAVSSSSERKTFGASGKERAVGCVQRS